jgi:basic amino acid/polyamine antiporter, APA family
MTPGQETFLGNMYAYGAMLSFTTAHVSLIGLRWRLAHNRMKQLPGDIEVPNGEDDWYRAPFNLKVRAMQVPLFAVLGGLLTATAWITVMVLHRDILIAGSAWMALGLSTYVIYRHSQGLSLTKTHKIELPPAVGVSPVSYATVIVAFEEDTYSAAAMATALKLASHRRGDVRVLVTLEIPNHLDLNAALARAELDAQQIIETARQRAERGQRVRGTIVRVRPGEAGHRIVAEAIKARAEAIVMPMPQNRPPGKLLNRTLEVVLGKRPCRVVIDSQPARSLERAGIGSPGAAEPFERALAHSPSSLG